MLGPVFKNRFYENIWDLLFFNVFFCDALKVILHCTVHYCTVLFIKYTVLFYGANK